MKTTFSNLILTAGDSTFTSTKEDFGKWDCNRWRVTVKNTDNGKSTWFYYYTGTAHSGLVNDREMIEALDCFINDARNGLDTFEDFCGEYGYDYDSRRAQKIWFACKEAWSKFERIGVDFEDLYESVYDFLNGESA